MSQNKYLPLKTRKEKINFLNGVMDGTKRISDLLENPYKISMWQQDDSDADYLISFDGLKRIAKRDYESEIPSAHVHHITLNLRDEKSNQII